MSKVEFQLNRAGVRELLRSAEMQGILSEEAEKIRSRCTAGNVGAEEYEAKVVTGRNRAVAYVHPNTAHAYYSNFKHNTLTKAMGQK